MSDYDLLRADSYALHLAAVNQTQDVLATEDIVNDKGVLLVKKGQPLRAGTAQQLLNHRLSRPLDTSVSVGNALDGRRLFSGILELLNQDPESHAIYQALNLDPPLKHVCFQLKAFPLLAQKLTVMSLRLPDEFQKALYCAWFSLALAVQMRQTEVDYQQAFFAGLAHNVGLLHIDPTIVNKTGIYCAQEWRAVQTHPLIGAAFLAHVPKMPAAVRRAVREHHERCDGSGYPAALWEDRLSVLGQIVAMADTVWGISKPVNEDRHRSLADVLTIIKMNRAQFLTELESALYHLQYRAHNYGNNLPAHQPRNQQNPARLQTLQRELESRFSCMLPLRELLEPQATDIALRGAYVRCHRILFVVNGSGMLSKQLIQAALESETAANQAASSYEFYELDLMLAELHWQFFQLERAVEQVVRLSEAAQGATRQKLQLVLDALRAVNGDQAGVVDASGGAAEPALVEPELRWTVR